MLRQALAGMLWSKQFFHYDLAKWLREHGDKPGEGLRAQVRNKHWCRGRPEEGRGGHGNAWTSPEMRRFTI